MCVFSCVNLCQHPLSGVVFTNDIYLNDIFCIDKLGIFLILENKKSILLSFVLWQKTNMNFCC